ncbi:kinase-like protein [Gonapodya prolifera JEL478]|uniref:mitogen-activated protein kinase kinase n=1 Tax=Gonapodya prolifera (strain JEL478) TaxID=1344416 RepID=A0A139ARV3_GONPJ|nr:kinase-like protein [Gonapodya prolifera JEL478]|eukprot:KXS19476.1 kinase-like protein [Gonapodya prolifera JEL478]
MSPECIRGVTPSLQSAIWGLGVLCLEMATGRHPLFPPAESSPQGIIEVITRIVNEDPPAVPTGAGLTEAFENFVARCLKKEPKERARVQELLEHPFLMKGGDGRFAAGMAEQL